MVYLLGGLCAVLALTAAALAVKIALLRRAARELREGLTERLEGEDTNTLLTLPTRDRDMRALASDLNGQLRLLRERRHRYQQGDLTVKEAVTEVAHDLRTPLTAIRGYLDLPERDVPAEKFQRPRNFFRARYVCKDENSERTAEGYERKPQADGQGGPGRSPGHRHAGRFSVLMRCGTRSPAFLTI